MHHAQPVFKASNLLEFVLFAINLDRLLGRISEGLGAAKVDWIRLKWVFIVGACVV